jgi:AraC-like DNA-binding protein
MPVVREISTADIEPQRRLEYWREGARAIGGMHAQSAGAARFDGHAKVAILENLKFGRLTVSANEACWTRDLIRQTDDGFLRLILQCRGMAQVEQGSSRYVLRPGEWTLLASSSPHTIRCSEPIEELLVIVPLSSIVSRLRDMSRRFEGAHFPIRGMSAVLFQFARSILEDLETPSAIVDDHLEGAGCALIRALFSQHLGGDPRPRSRDSRIKQVRAYITEHLRDPNLSVQRIADAMDVSKRYIHSLFEGEQSVHGLIWQSRLQECARALKRADMHKATIVSLALSHGFNCPAHFSRLFKAHFGVSPRDFRKRPN